MISFVSAFEFDNVKSYNENTKTITIKNSFLGLPLDKVAEIELKTPLNFEVPQGYQKVAEFEIRNFEDYTNALKELNFYNLRDENKEFVRDFDYKYKTYINISVDDYESVIVGKSANGTNIYERQLIGSHLELKEKWVKLNSYDFNKDDILTIGIFTEVKKGDIVEWIPTFYGKEINEWAVWTQSLNVGLVSFYKLDGVSGGVNDSTQTNNGTNSGATRGVSGIINNSFDFESTSGNYINLGNDISFNTNEVSFSAWINIESNPGVENYIIGKWGANKYILLTKSDDTAQAVFRTAGGENRATSNVSLVIGQWMHIVATWDDTTGGRLYFNGTLVGTNNDNSGILSSSTAITYIGTLQASGLEFDGKIDEVGFWNRTLSSSEIIQLYNDGSGITWTDIFIPAITLNSPINTFNTTSQTINFNGTVISSDGIINVTLIIDGINNETNSSGINATDYLFTKIITDGNHNWTYESCNINGCVNATVRTFTIDTTFPQITIETPTGILDFGKVGFNETLNVTFTDTNLDTCWFDYNGTNITIDGCLTGVKNSTIFSLEEGNFNMTVYANDTVGNENSSFTSWSYFVFENSQTFSANTTEGSIETFSINFTANETTSSANFVYNGTITSADIDTSNFPIIIVSETITIPNVDTQTVFQFFWNIISSSSNINITANNQTVNSVSIDNCTSFSNILFNYTIVDEATQVILNGSVENTSLEVDISIFNSGRTLSILNFSTTFNETNPNAICSENALNGTGFILDSTAKYSSSTRAIEYYNIRDADIDDIISSPNITLFDIKTSESTDFQITFKDSNFVVVEGALIQVNRQYVSEGVFKTVELPITDSNGQTVVHLVKNDVVYNYIVTKNSIIIGTFNNLIAFCEDETIGQCFIALSALQETTSVFNPDVDIGITSSFSFNETTRDIAFTFSTNDGTVRTILLNATKMDQLGNTSVCSTSVTSSSGTLICNVPASLGNETIIMTVFVNGELKITQFFKAANDIILGNGGYFLLLFLVISLGLMFDESKSMMIVGVILGFITGGLLFFIKGGIIGGGSAIMWLIIMGMILIWKLNSEGQT